MKTDAKRINGQVSPFLLNLRSDTISESGLDLPYDESSSLSLVIDDETQSISSKCVLATQTFTKVRNESNDPDPTDC
jgi:hypothetical protein